MSNAQLAGFRMMAETLTSKPETQTVTLVGPQGQKAEVKTTCTGGFWFNHPTQGRIWVKTFEAK
ncbi:MAG TPA: hypothetical protein VK395_07605 [Gemmataceae bacterium]|nr:hypothetical protein [Gemmataceae bacterium]